MIEISHSKFNDSLSIKFSGAVKCVIIHLVGKCLMENCMLWLQKRAFEVSMQFYVKLIIERYRKRRIIGYNLLAHCCGFRSNIARERNAMQINI